MRVGELCFVQRFSWRELWLVLVVWKCHGTLETLF